MATMTVLDSTGAAQTVEKPLAPGRAAAASSRPVALSSEDFAVIDGLETLIGTTNTNLATINTTLGVPMKSTGGTVGLVAGAAIIGSLAANQSVNVSQMNGVTVLMGNGASGTGAQRVTIANDSTGILAGVTTVATVTNLSQFGGAAINLGAGAVGTGTLRTTQASDSPLVAATGAIGDAAWSSGNGTMIALLKAMATQLLAVDDPLEYETVAASATDQMMGATGAAGDYLEGLLVIPTTTSPGEVSIEDGSTNTIVFNGGASSVSNLIPFYIPLGFVSVSGGWEITTGANVRVIASGNFT